MVVLFLTGFIKRTLIYSPKRAALILVVYSDNNKTKKNKKNKNKNKLNQKMVKIEKYLQKQKFYQQ